MDKILVLDFGGQYDQLIARRVRDLCVYAQIRAYNRITLEEILADDYKGIILTGGPNSVYEEDALHFDPGLLEAGIPILGICYGMQLLAYMAGGKVSKAGENGEYGKTRICVKDDVLFKDLPQYSISWMSHRDQVMEVPDRFRIIASTENCGCAAFGDDEKRIYGVQFHPEVTHTEYGEFIFRNFLFEVCHCRDDWQMDDFIEKTVAKLREELKDRKVLLGLSGGVDSSVAAVLLHKAIGKDLTCVFVDHGMMREGEADEVEEVFGKTFDLNLLRVDAKERFLEKLKGITDPEAKRKIIGEEFVRVFEQEANKAGNFDYLAQGTIYPDVIESGKGDSATIKSHHNVGGLPENVDFKGIVEPLKDLFKDEVRKVGEKLGIPKDLICRQPFPGPGLGVRVLGEVTAEKLDILRRADAIFTHEIKENSLEGSCSQYFAVLTDSRSVGVKGDARAYSYVLALRAVKTDDFMTAEWTRLPYDFLEKVSSRICNEIAEISRVVYDITSKPPGTIEWE